ncbi:Cof-type HAD-IIB family hydrolase [Enterococcus raffinosus]|uniref:Cof-type HAD-IIB family hydrolase n=1 Tax=Enterococcus raffinosus TaxID=71452 RepID=A0AAW8TGD9_9ENTE|nr:Cof-type HAD-IIB family hydrolase [Enterococcus raffinosus]MDT2524872.1 Cof-type HAD-IIB family hydrolase [Enterococcus raffinosus]MDT2535596.1 Cof-type HAD-IIB family hydrolase [Enterococcus raffinosus]MDT2546122.1 Cof-type HAD-IIB family hydrolase [Enterococcus raffinosus]MDT2554922.1 Cof-type HAD-IIB family hydrolase [Enterococcus raffinosus]MDT2579533.1 Cof-type HAD-IIB family hydrolase [Enterococcus raffinosus]
MIKAVAVDMDGTFLNSQNDYDRPRFEALFSQMKEKGIRFIVASGNQYYQLRSFFSGDRGITYVSENGALIFNDQGLQWERHFSKELTEKIMTFLVEGAHDLEFVACGVKSSYLLESASEEFKKFARIYSYRLEELADFDDLPEDPIVKFALDVEVEKTYEIAAHLNKAFGGEITAVTSGHGSIDIIIPGVTKGRAIKSLLDEWGIEPNELAAFGDANNDLEMLALTEYSYAMKECSPEVLATAKHQAPSHNESGVLQVLEDLIQ